MVRGSAVLTHLYSNANPLVVPLCLASINGDPVTYQCPAENPSIRHVTNSQAVIYLNMHE